MIRGLLSVDEDAEDADVLTLRGTRDPRKQVCVWLCAREHFTALPASADRRVPRCVAACHAARCPHPHAPTAPPPCPSTLLFWHHIDIRGASRVCVLCGAAVQLPFPRGSMPRPSSFCCARISCVASPLSAPRRPSFRSCKREFKVSSPVPFPCCRCLAAEASPRPCACYCSRCSRCARGTA
jgi:hypothetical protein